MRIKVLMGTLWASAVLWNPAVASDSQLRIVVPFQAGSATDAAARIIGDRLSVQMNRPVIVDNKPGAEGLIAAREVIKSNPSGDVMLFSTNTAITAINTFYPKPHYDPLTDLTPIARVADFPFLLVSRADLPFKDAGAFVEAAKAKSGTLNYASGSSSSLIAMTQLMGMAKLDMHHIPYNSEPPAVLDLMGGRIDVMFATPTTTKGFLAEKKLNALMTTSPTRLPQFPDVPTLTQAGFEELALLAWGGFFGPGGMSDETKEELSRHITAALKDPSLVEALAQHNITVNPSGPDEFTEFVKTQLQLSAQVVKENNLMRQ